MLNFPIVIWVHSSLTTKSILPLCEKKRQISSQKSEIWMERLYYTEQIYL